MNEQETTYKVGQILYVILNKQAVVYPIMCVEKIVKHTVNGIEIDYVFVSGLNGTGDTLNLKDIKGEIVETSKLVKQILTTRVLAALDKMINNAVNKAAEWYPNSFEANNELQILPDKHAEHQTLEHNMTVMMEDGTVAHVKLPDVFT